MGEVKYRLSAGLVLLDKTAQYCLTINDCLTVGYTGRGGTGGVERFLFSAVKK